MSRYNCIRKTVLRTNVLILFVFCGLLLLSSGCSRKPVGTAEQPTGRLRIVSLAPSVTEMLFAIGAGDLLVGRTSACNLPEAAARVPVTGAFGRPSLEVIASVHPDLVIDEELSNQEGGKKVSAMGFRRETISCKTPDDIPSALRKLGRLTGHEERADSLALSISTGLANFRKNADTGHKKSRVYLEIWDNPLWTGGSESYISALIAYSGGRNIGDVVRKEYFDISPEWVIKQNPDVIACMYMAKNSSASDKIRSRYGWDQVAAVKNRRVYDRFDNSLFLRPGPRVLEGIEQLRTIIRESEKSSL
jgi:iron complex transport system substrate-binding protein